MKKLLFGFVVLFMFSGNVFAQTINAECQKKTINSSMVTIVNGAKIFYVKGQKYEDFLQAMLIPSPTVPSQDEFFKKVYFYVSSNTPDCEILNSDNSILSKFALDMSKSDKNQGDSSSLFGKKKWWQNLIEAVINLTIDVLLPENQTTVVIWEP